MHAKHDRLSTSCSSEEANGHPAPSKAAEPHLDAKPSSDQSEGATILAGPQDSYSSGQNRTDWSPGRIRKVYYSYFEREDDDVDSNDK